MNILGVQHLWSLFRFPGEALLLFTSPELLEFQQRAKSPVVVTAVMPAPNNIRLNPLSV